MLMNSRHVSVRKPRSSIQIRPCAWCGQKNNSPKGVGVNVLPKGQNRLKNKVNSELKNGHFKEYLLEDI